MIDGISSLYHLKASNPDKALEKACQEFETIFTHQLLKTMGASLEEGFAAGGLAGEMYNDMLYLEMARAATHGRGFGLAEVLRHQLAGRGGTQGQVQGGQHVTDKHV